MLERMSAAEIAQRIEQLQTEIGRRFGEESEAVLLIGDLPMPAEFRTNTDTDETVGLGPPRPNVETRLAENAGEC